MAPSRFDGGEGIFDANPFSEFTSEPIISAGSGRKTTTVSVQRHTGFLDGSAKPREIACRHPADHLKNRPE
jgi:hypothetical protein